MAKTTTQTAILFSDVSGSSKLYKEAGDEIANKTVSQCIDMMAQKIQAQNGIVIKTIGDEIMARFDTALQASQAAVAIQRDQSPDTRNLSFRIGMAYGNAILDNGDVFGQVVNDASAVVKIAMGNQILVTDDFSDSLGCNPSVTLAPFDKIKLKGSESISTIFRLAWESNEVTSSSTVLLDINAISKVSPTQETRPIRNRITLSFCNKSFSIDEQDTPFVVGRDDETCNLAINSTLVSRDHFHIVFQRGKFVLIDHSTNGTYVKVKDTNPIYLRREELPLTEEGAISLGQTIDVANNLLVTYSI